jgi:tetratricopeptide (TPR) repeat protein
MSVKIFLSTVSDEFRAYRDALRTDLTRHNVEVKVQEDFKDLGGDTLDKLDVYIAHCDAVVHLVGNMTGSAPGELALRALRKKYPDLTDKLPPLCEALRNGISVSYTQWEAWLALYHDKRLFIAEAGDSAERGPKYAPTAGSRGAQVGHLARLRKADRYPGHTFVSPADLAKHIAYTAILDLLVKAYGEEVARARDVAEGFIHEMAKRVAGDQNLGFEGMKQAVRNAIDIYEREIAGQTQTNIDVIVDEALARAVSLVNRGKSGLARAALRRAAESMRREEEERRERYVAGVTALHDRERDIALAAYDGEAAAEAIILRAEAIHGANTEMVARSLNSEAATLYEYGRDRGSNVHLIALIILRRKLLDAASSDDERGLAQDNLGTALWTLGDRESGTARLEEAVAAYRDALKQRTRERVPLDWAGTQNNLGIALSRLGERESGTARLEEAVAAYRDALKEYTRERVPLDWATAQNNLGLALQTLGERESGTARLEEAVAALSEALKEWTRERVPLRWATGQNNLGLALQTLGARESGTARLEEAVAAYRDALKDYTRERVPLDWATAQNNLGIALQTLGARESGTARLEEAVAAYRDALKERTRERVPLDWAMTQNNLGNALVTLGERESGTARLEEAVAAYRDALKEYTRERVPLQWAGTQNNLGNALVTLGAHESSTARLEEAVAAYRDALKEWTRERVPLQWAGTQNNLGNALEVLGARESSTARLEEAVAAYRDALKERTRERVPLDWAMTQNNLETALRLLDERKR